MYSICNPTSSNSIPLSKSKFLTIGIRYGRLGRRSEIRVRNQRLAVDRHRSLVTPTSNHKFHHRLSESLPISTHRWRIEAEPVSTRDQYTVGLTSSMSKCATLDKGCQGCQISNTGCSLLWTNKYTLIKSKLSLHSLWTIRDERNTCGR